ncbi:MAG: PLP-dependent transferase [Planctomycetes bacterium]|nr:PLP-dependent transferase [Planctomycetota bacterium]
MSLPNTFRLETQIVHAGEPHPRVAGAVVMPVFQSSTYEYSDGTGYHDLKYIRLNNTPNHAALHEKLALLEGGESALVTSSGMAAITTTLLTVLRAGDHLLAQDCLYGGTHGFLTTDLAALGIAHTFIDADDPGSWKTHLRENTRAIYCESITNPLMQVADLPAVARFAKEHELVSLIDGTFTTPINFRPIEHGFDLVLHSCTKYLNGHTDIVGGAVIGRAEMIESIKRKLDHFGGSLDPHACFLLHRGIKTLAVRVRQQNESAPRIARMLESHERVASVNYPGLESHPRHARAAELFNGYGGMLSFEPTGGAAAARRFMDRLTVPIVAPSLGGVESLISMPAQTSHVGMPPEQRRRLGISDSLVRMSVGIESVDDLIADLEAALRAE